MSSTSPALALVLLAALGITGIVVGLIGMSGRLARGPSWGYFTNHTSVFLFGWALLLAGVTLWLPEDSAAAMLVGFPAAACLLLATFCRLLFVPNALKPRWQRQLDRNLKR